MVAQSFDQPRFVEFFAGRVKRLRYAIGVERDSVTWRKIPLTRAAIPSFEESQDGASGLEALELVVLAKEKGGKMPAVSVAEAAGLIVVLCKKEGSKSAVGGILVEKPIYREQEALGLFQNKRHVGAA